MKPPICAICDKRFETGGGLVYFKEDNEDIEFNKRLSQPDFVGHPTNAFWFCELHISKAKELSHLSKRAAFEKLRE